MFTLILLWVVARLVPASHRGRWLEEWRAELLHARRSMILGALPDAWALRRGLGLPRQTGDRRVGPLRGLGEDLSYATRTIIKSPAFALCIIGSLSLGIAAMIAAFTFLNAFLFRPFPGIRDQHELVKILPPRECAVPRCLGAVDIYAAFRDGMASVSALAAQSSDSIAVTIDGRAQSLRASVVTENYFEVLGVQPSIGRTFVTLPSTPDPQATVVIAHSLWRREFGLRADVLGTLVGLGASGSATIIGVAAPNFVGASRADVGILDRGIEMWVPLTYAKNVFPPSRNAAGDGLGEVERNFKYFGRLRGGATEEQAELEAHLIASRIAPAKPGQPSNAHVSGVWMNNPQQAVPMMTAILSVPLLVLIIGCVNAANLLLARAAHRAREVAVRLALGATRWRIVRQLLVESVLLSLLAAAASVPVVRWALSVVTRYVDLPMPLDQRVVAFAAAVAVLSAITFSLLPALRVSSTAPGLWLGSSRAGDGGPGRSRTRRALVVAQIALSLGLLATGGQLVTFLPAQAQSGGTPSEKLLMASFDVGQVHMSGGQADMFYSRLLDRVSALPDADSAGLARGTAVWMFGRGMGASAIAVERLEDPPGKGILALGGYAAGDLVRALGLKVSEGRTFTAADRGPRPVTAIINRPLAQAMFGGAALGRTVRVAAYRSKAAPADVTIVGIIEAAREPSYRREPMPAIYLPVPLEDERALTLYVRARDSAQNLAAGIRGAVRAVDDRVPPIEIRTLEQIGADRQFPERLAARSVSLLGAIGLLLATAGVYGVMSYLVSLRAREIGVRLAIGADPRAILLMTLSEAMRLAAWGAAVGLLGAVVTSKIVQSQMHGVKGLDLTYLAGSFLLLAGAMVLASAIPARRASLVDPITVLRQE